MSLFNLKSSNEDSYSRSANTPRFIGKFQLLLIKASFALIFTVSLLGAPSYVHAGLQIALEAEPGNPLAPKSVDVIIVDDSALLSEMGPSGTSADVEDEVDSEQINSIYVVRSGDNLSSIAKMYDVSVNTIIWMNSLKRGQTLTTGQQLIILPISGVQYTVKKGDTRKSIAKKFNADADEIGKFNGITDDTKLAIGDIIIIPDGEITAPVVLKKSSVSKSIFKDYSSPVLNGYFGFPVHGVLTQGLHDGFKHAVDIGAPRGSSIYAAASGTVVTASGSGYNGGYGKYVVIRHDNGTQTVYGHMSQVNISVGQQVEKGSIIGLVGNTGRSTGSHVHFEVHGAANPLGSYRVGSRI
ncbi:MAG: M23 family metallopeptidase [Candidatus Paceibacterota bacterium]|jgi:murein DD-endopeptidase MepM/ murein hydrolase activator NlpD